MRGMNFLISSARKDGRWVAITLEADVSTPLMADWQQTLAQRGDTALGDSIFGQQGLNAEAEATPYATQAEHMCYGLLLRESRVALACTLGRTPATTEDVLRNGMAGDPRLLKASSWDGQNPSEVLLWVYDAYANRHAEMLHLFRAFPDVEIAMVDVRLRRGVDGTAAALPAPCARVVELAALA